MINPRRAVPKCEVCRLRLGVRVASLPGVAMSVARCGPCHDAGAIPYATAVVVTAEIGGMHEAAPWWEEVVSDTLRYLDVAREAFETHVHEDIERWDAIVRLESSAPR